MTTLTVTSKGQVTLKKELLQHLGVKPGQKIEVDVAPDGKLLVVAARPKGSWDEFYGLLAGKTDKVATIEEMNEAIAKGWAGLHEDRDRYQSAGEDGDQGRRDPGADRNGNGRKR